MSDIETDEFDAATVETEGDVLDYGGGSGDDPSDREATPPRGKRGAKPVKRVKKAYAEPNSDDDDDDDDEDGAYSSAGMSGDEDDDDEDEDDDDDDDDQYESDDEAAADEREIAEAGKQARREAAAAKEKKQGALMDKLKLKLKAKAKAKAKATTRVPLLSPPTQPQPQPVVDEQSRMSADVEDTEVKAASASASASPPKKQRPKPKGPRASGKKMISAIRGDGGASLQTFYLQRHDQNTPDEVQGEVLSTGIGADFDGNVSKLTPSEIAVVMLFNDSDSPGADYAMSEVVFCTLVSDGGNNVYHQISIKDEEQIRKNAYPEKPQNYSVLRPIQERWIAGKGINQKIGGKNDGIYQQCFSKTLGHIWLCLASTMYMEHKEKKSRGPKAGLASADRIDTDEDDEPVAPKKAASARPKPVVSATKVPAGSAPTGRQVVVDTLRRQNYAVPRSVNRASTASPVASSAAAAAAPAPAPAASPKKKVAGVSGPNPKSKRKADNDADDAVIESSAGKKARAVVSEGGVPSAAMDVEGASYVPDVKVQCTYTLTGSPTDIARFNKMWAKLMQQMTR